MGLIRLIAYGLLIWVVWSMVKNYLAKQRRANMASSEKDGAKIAAKKVVKCRYCDLHLPEEDAVANAAGSFCSQSHKQAWLEQNP